MRYIFINILAMNTIGISARLTRCANHIHGPSFTYICTLQISVRRIIDKVHAITPFTIGCHLEIVGRHAKPACKGWCQRYMGVCVPDLRAHLKRSYRRLLVAPTSCPCLVSLRTLSLVPKTGERKKRLDKVVEMAARFRSMCCNLRRVL